MTKRLSIILLGIIMAFATIIGNFNFVGFVNAEEQTEIPTVINTPLLDENFSTISGGYPSGVSGWTSNKLHDKVSSDVVTGVISLKVDSLLAKVRNKDNPYKLPSDFEKTINIEKIASSDSNDKNANVLMISSLNTTAYSYQSSTYSVKANSYYELSVLVYTPDFSTLGENANYGAFIALNGDIQAVSQPISTNHQWQKYSIYFSGHSYKSSSVSVSLQLGDSRTKDEVKSLRPATGYAFFDMVVLQPISHDAYYRFKENPSTNAYFADEAINDITPEDFNGNFDSGLTNWKSVNNTATVTVSSDVYLPFGTHALKMSTEGKGMAYAGLRSAALNIERHKYYRMGIWQNNAGIKTGAGYATVVTIDKDKNIEKLGTLNNFTQNLGENSWLGKWSQGSFFIQGSSLMDKQIYIELWFGNKDSLASGTVYFDNITLEEILPEEYNANSSGGTTVTFSDAVGNGPTLTNGDFNTIGNYKTYSYPMPVASWTSVFKKENEDKTITGIVRGDKDHFISNKQKYGAPAYPYTADRPNTNLLMVTNTAPSAYGYSTSISVDTESYKKISVSLQTQISAGYGAELILKSGDIVVSRFANINTNGSFQTFNFYVNSGINAQTLTLEIWLGIEGGFNNQYYSSGSLFVELADAVASEEAAYLNATSIFDTRYDFSIENFETFEKSDKALKTPANWTAVNPFTNIKTVKAGIINLNEYDMDVLGINKAKIGTDNVSPYALVIYSPEKTAYGMKQAFPITYTADKYYKITVRIKTVDVPEGSGARIVLDTDHYFEGINTELEKNNFDNKFIDYSFFVNAGASPSTTHNLTIWLSSQGLVVVDQIKTEIIDETAYANGIAKLSSENEKEIPNNVAKVVLGETSNKTTPEETTKRPFEWWVLPAILFSALLIFSLALIVIRYAPKPRRRVKAGSIAYDRRLTINKSVNLKKEAQPINKVEEEKIKTEIDNQEVEATEEIKQDAPKLIRKRKHIIKEFKDEFED